MGGTMNDFRTVSILLASLFALTLYGCKPKPNDVSEGGNPQQLSPSPAGKLIPAAGPWGAIVRVEGVHFGSANGARAMWFENDDPTTKPIMNQTSTLRGHYGPDAIEVQIPADPAKSGWSGNFTSGVLRLMLIMPDKSVIYAGRYTIGGGGTKSE